MTTKPEPLDLNAFIGQLVEDQRRAVEITNSAMEEIMDWKPTISYTALTQRVIAVATTRVEGAWCAYIGAVQGIDHRLEWEAVLRFGDKLPEEIAAAIFPTFVDKGWYAS